MNKAFFSFVAATAAIFVNCVAFGATWYVSPNGTGDGSTEGNPCDLATGWAKFTAKPTVDTELVLADGTYKLTAQLGAVNVADVKKNITYLMRSKSGNPENCIIDGQNQCRMLRFVDGGQTYYNCYAVLRGIKFVNGKYTSPTSSNDGGGAMYFGGRMENCIVENSSVVTSIDAYGGGLFCEGGTVISNSIVRGCTAQSSGNEKPAGGGGIYARSTISVYDSQILNCSVKVVLTKDGESGGGGLYNYGNCTITVRNLLISGCSVVNTGDAKYNGYAKGGGLYIRFGTQHTFKDMKIYNCSACGHGGAVYRNNDGGPDLYTDCTFESCSAGVTGGAIQYVNVSHAVFNRCLFKGNSAAYVAAVAFGRFASTATTPSCCGVPTISNCVFRANTCTAGAGVILTTRGGTVVDSVIENNTINTAGTVDGGILFSGEVNLKTNEPFLFENLIIRNNQSSATASTGWYRDGVFWISCADTGCYTNYNVRNCYITGNTATSILSVDSGYSHTVEDDGLSIYFKNCTITGNTLSSAVAMFDGYARQTTPYCLFVQNCDLRGNTGPTKVMADFFYSKNPRRFDHCAYDAGMTNISTDPQQGNIAGSGSLAGKGAYQSWMEGATDGGDGTYTETPSSVYGVNVTINGKSNRILGAKPDIGARETNEGGTPLGPDPLDEQIRAFLDPKHAIVLTEGDVYTLPAVSGQGSYVSLSDYRFLAIDGNKLTALNAGIGLFKAYNRDGAYIATVKVFIKPKRTVENVYILNTSIAKDKYAWSEPSNWTLVGAAENISCPDGQNDIAFVPFGKHGSTLTVDGSYSLAGLYCALAADGLYSSQYLVGNKADGSASLSFYGTTGKNPVPACFMAANLSSGYTLDFYPRGTDLASKITFKVAKGTLDIDCGGPTDKIKSAITGANVMRWNNDKIYGVYDVPADCTLRVVNGVRYGSFGDGQMYSVQHINMGSADIFTGAGTIEFNTCSPIALWNNPLRSFSGTVRSQMLNYIRELNENRSGILWSVDVNAPAVDGEINGFVTKQFTPAYGVGAWTSGNSHGYGDPGEMLGNGIPGKSLALNGGMLCLIGMNKTGSDTTFWKRADGKYEAHYQTGELRVGKGLSCLLNSYSATVSDTGVISHFIADKLVHSDPCGTLRVTDQHFVQKKTAVGVYRSENQLGGFADHYVGYTGAPDYASNKFPIVPWAIGRFDYDSRFWWLSVDENGYVVCKGSKSSVKQDNMQVNQNAMVAGNINLAADKDVNSLILQNYDYTKTLGAGRTLTIRSGGLGLEGTSGTTKAAGLGTQTGGAENGTVVFSEKAFVFATSDSETNPNQIWSSVKAEKGFVFGYCGNLLLGGDQTGIKGELTINNGTLQLGSMDGTVGCTLGVTEVRAIGGNTVLRINKNGALEGKTVRFDCPGGFSPKFKLQNTEAERCYKLFIDGKSIKSGTWGASGSGAANIDDEHFTGPGQLIVQRDDVGVGFSMVFRP